MDSAKPWSSSTSGPPGSPATRASNVRPGPMVILSSSAMAKESPVIRLSRCAPRREAQAGWASGMSGECFSDPRPVSQRVFMSGHELDGELRVARAAQRIDAPLDLGLACRKRGGADQLGAHEAL